MTRVQGIRLAIMRRLAGGGRPLRFLIAGGVNTAFGLAFYPVLLWSIPALHRHYMAGLIVAQAATLCFSFAVYKAGVFRTRSNMAREFGAFASFHGVNYALNWLALPALVHVAKIDPIPAQLGYSVLFLAVSYFWHRHITFRADGDS